MTILINIIIITITIIHLYIMWFEMMAWTTKGPKVFQHFPKDLFAPTKVMAGNQGLYNGFLAAGLMWSLTISDGLWSNRIALFFLCCVAIAGIYGSLTASKKIFFIQTVPAIIGIALIFIKLYQ